MRKIVKVGFGGGCHWCTEAIFQSLIGVEKVEQGWIASAVPNDNFSEAVIVHFFPDEIELSILINIHLHTHSCTELHSMRSKYRSAVYAFSEKQEQEIKNILSDLQQEFEERIITEVLAFKDFKRNQENYLNYYYSNPEKPFCKNYISPKLKKLTDKFSRNVKK
ncbi:peptide-methionine (S)-S-oxide reductase [Marivirga sericea]|uniref:peptide-methionine (S)-S-oxide reductase n=1 Tax=Marivirga sericea TaxID=1028 RepID=A0A1X7IDF5_9BACT|nr:peptide-methionine (S)-S-oxide reductase [Marivirga sericea]SMG12585.1 peptide-methionine (S)-S-oxide reductase [Marivirga sericea]